MLIVHRLDGLDVFRLAATPFHVWRRIPFNVGPARTGGLDGFPNHHQYTRTAPTAANQLQGNPGM